MADHYFSTDPRVPDVRSEVGATIWGQEFTFTTARGVFSRDGLDKATRILLDTGAPPPHGSTVLDLGCGWGPIAVPLAAASPGSRVVAVDTNARAVDLTRLNADRAGVTDRVSAYLPDEVPAETRFDAIWSNPPIRIGKAALHELLLRWLPRLRPDGQARLVVGKNLGSDSLQRWLGEQGWPTERQTSLKGFRVLVVRHG